MSDRDKSPPASCGKQQPRGDVKQYQGELHTQALSEGSFKLKAALLKESSGTEGHQVLDLIHNTGKQEDDWKSPCGSHFESKRATIMGPPSWLTFENLQSSDDESWDSPLITIKEHFKRVHEEPECTSKETISEIYEKQEIETFYSTQSLKCENLSQYVPELLLLQKSCPKGLESWVRESWCHHVTEEAEHIIEIQNIFVPSIGTHREPQLVVLQGVAGIGKSILARQVRRAWEEGQLYRDRFQHVFFFSCRELAQCEHLSLAELIAQGQAVPTAPIRQILSHPEKLLFILDGIDEPAWVLEDQNPELCLHWSQPQPVHTLLGSLLGKSILPEASFLLTARITALHRFIPSLGQPRWVEVLGFSESGRKKYFYKYFAEERDAIAAFSVVESNPELSTLCLVPWVCWLVCTCLSQQMEQSKVLSLISKTTTALCLKYLSQTVPSQLPRTQLRALCSLAGEGMCRRRSLFSEHDLEIQGLAKADIVTFLKIGILQKQPNSQSYSFAHLCLQEFFAAMSYVLGDNERWDDMENHRIIKTLIEVYGRQDLFEAPIVHFLFGLLSEQGLSEMEMIFGCTLPLKTKLKFLSDLRAKTVPYQLGSRGLLHCLFENRDEELLKKVMNNLEEERFRVLMDKKDQAFQTNMKHLVIKTDVELMVVAFCIKFCCNLKTLHLNRHGQRRQELKGTSIVLSRWTPISNAIWKILFYNLKFTRSLEELDLSGNSLSYSAVQSLCRTLRHPACHLRTLWLVDCGLTSRDCTVLASVLSAGTSLTELDLQLNDLGDDGVMLLCEGLRSLDCNLSILWLDQAPLSYKVIAELRALEEGNPQLLISSTRGRVHKTCITGASHPSASASPRDKHMEPLGTKYDFWGPTGRVDTEVVDRERNLYRVQFPGAGSYHSPNTGLHFVVTKPITIEIGFCDWSQFLGRTPFQHSHMVAGPLFDIKAEHGAVAAVHLPHFVSLQEGQVDSSLFHVAHFQEHGMVLETPAMVEQSYAVLENPSFSPVGVLLRMIPAVRNFIPITSITLIYYHRKPEDVTFHLYLVPNDCTIRKAIDDEEKRFEFEQINKPPPVDSLCIGSRYIVSASKNLNIIPVELELCYRSPSEAQLFSEIYVGHMDSEIKLKIRDKKRKNIIWKALLKPGDLRPVPLQIVPVPKDAAAALLHFVDQHREQLVARVTSVDPVLDKLHGLVLSEEEYEAVRAEATNPDKMRKLFSFSWSWSWDCKDQLYQALKKIHPHLIMDLLEKSSGVSVGS